MSGKPILIDGSMGEGGGQVLRTTIALSAVTGVPVKIVNIRAKRKKPGLQRQHLTSVKAVAALSNAVVKGLELGSTTLEFYPRELRAGEFRFDIGTAGSVTLVFQAIMPLLPFLPGRTSIVVTGGTDVPWSPTVDYVRGVVVPILSLMGLNVKVELIKRGHYPRGGGLVRYVVEDPPGRLEPLRIEKRGEIRMIQGLSHATMLPPHVAERQARSAVEYLREKLGNIKMLVDLEKDPSGTRGIGPGSSIALWAICDHSVLGSDSLGERGKPAEKVGMEAAMKLVEDLSTTAALDRHMSDIIIPMLALARGESVVTGSKLTLHARTNIMVVEKILGVEVKIEGREESFFKLTVRGRGVSR